MTALVVSAILLVGVLAVSRPTTRAARVRNLRLIVAPIAGVVFAIAAAAWLLDLAIHFGRPWVRKARTRPPRSSRG